MQDNSPDTGIQLGVVARIRLLPLSTKLAVATALVAAAIGVVARSWGLGTMSFWVDEAAVANPLSRASDFSLYFEHPLYHRPFLYLLLSDFLLAIRNTELTVRLLSWVPGVGALWLLWTLGRAAGLSRATCSFLVILLAFNPYAIGQSKDFKPYSLEVAITALLLLWTCRVLFHDHEGSRRWLLFASPLLPLLGYPALFVVGGTHGGLTLLALRSRTYLQAVKYASSAIATASVFYAQYALFTHDMPTQKFTGFDGTNFFQTASGPLTTWTLSHLKDYVFKLATPKVFWHILPVDFLEWSMVALTIAGIVSLATSNDPRRQTLLFVLVFPIVETLGLSIALKWPFGAMRVNLFVIVYVNLIVGFGVRSFALRLRASKAVGTAFVLATFLTFFPHPLSYYSQKNNSYWAKSEEFKPLLNELTKTLEERGEPFADDTLTVNFMGSYALEYYTQHRSGLAAHYATTFEKLDSVEILSSRSRGFVQDSVAALLRNPGDYWFAFTHFKPFELKELHAAVKASGCQELWAASYPRAVGIAVTCTANAKEPRSSDLVNE